MLGKKIAHFSATKDSLTIKIELQLINNDIIMMITGGDEPHIGSVTTFSKGISQTTCFLCDNGKRHKDHIISEKILDMITPFIYGNCVITAGIHIDHISSQQITDSYLLAENLGNSIVQWLKNNAKLLKEKII